MPVFNERAQGSFKEIGGGVLKKYISIQNREILFLKNPENLRGPQLSTGAKRHRGKVN